MLKLPRAWLSRPISDFVNEEASSLLGELGQNSLFSIELDQQNAWARQIELLKPVLSGLEGEAHFELGIPRLGKRVDVLLILDGRIFVIEFKVGGRKTMQSALDQVWDYALDLKCFHEASHNAEIVPILVPTELGRGIAEINVEGPDDDGVWSPSTIDPARLRLLLEKIIGGPKAQHQVGRDWIEARYQPTPTIVEAARNLYAQHSVQDILRSDAGARNIATTADRIEEVIEDARRHGKKTICFVTGVPGAGKTLVGLQLATRHKKKDDEAHAVYLSGNGPLVRVLVEALARDEVDRSRRTGDPILKKDAIRRVRAFIQNVHHFRDQCLKEPGPPSDNVVIFDEAQRAWDRSKTIDFMRRRKGIEGFDYSEPEFLISCLDRHDDWAVIVCLVGGGQEIHVGEGGISGWLEALRHRFADWEIHLSDCLADSEYMAAEALDDMTSTDALRYDPGFHLSTSMRSFRAENVSAFVKHLLDGEAAKARVEASVFLARYPIVLTRNLEQAKDWARKRARGSERIGLVASSKAQRLKPHAIDVRVDVDPVHYFLNSAADVRSSFYLEDAATEFQIQGLELDWVVVSWDGDLRRQNKEWEFHHFRGCGWTRVHKLENRAYLRNAYRVLLTRARQGMAVFVPSGEARDATRHASYYDETFRHLKACGLPVLGE